MGPWIADLEVSLRQLAKTPAFTFASIVVLAHQQLAQQRDLFSGVLAHSPTLVGLREGGESKRTFAVVVSRNYVDVLGVPVAQGRGFTAEEDRPGPDIPVVVASHAYCQRTGFSATLVGSNLRVNERAYTVA